jgi:O-antigen/teichoic acid export membrane protein
MLRSIGAVAAGYLVFATSAVLLFQLSGQAPHEAASIPFMIVSVLWGAVSALIAGWLTGRIAVRRPATHAAVVAAVIAAGALASLLARPSDAMWSQAAALAVMAPCAWIGGALAGRAGNSDIGRVRPLR